MVSDELVHEINSLSLDDRRALLKKVRSQMELDTLSSFRERERQLCDTTRCELMTPGSDDWVRVTTAAGNQYEAMKVSTSPGGQSVWSVTLVSGSCSNLPLREPWRLKTNGLDSLRTKIARNEELQ